MINKMSLNSDLQQTQLLYGVQKLIETSNHLQIANKLDNSSLEIGSSTLIDLENQNQRLVNVGKQVDQIDDSLIESHKWTKKMIQKAMTNRMVLILIIILLIIVIGLILWLKIERSLN